MRNVRDSDIFVIRLCSEFMLTVLAFFVGGPRARLYRLGIFVPLLFPVANGRSYFENFLPQPMGGLYSEKFWSGRGCRTWERGVDCLETQRVEVLRE